MEIKYELKDFDKGKLVDKFGLQKDGKAQLFLANTCFRRMQKYTPQDTGTMSTTATIKPGKIIYETDYAYYQYIGKTKGKVKHYTTPRTGKYWDRKMKNAEGQMVVQEVSNYIAHMKGGK